MRLLMVASNYPPTLGGVQTYAFELARRLVERSDQLLVVAPRSAGDREFDTQSKLQVLRLPEAGEDLALTGIPALTWLLLRREFDVAFTTHWAPAYAVLQAARLANAALPVYVAAHGKELLQRPLADLPLVQEAYDRMRAHVLRHARGFFPVSRRTAQLLAAAGVEPARVEVVNDGVDPERFKPGDAGALRAELSSGGPVLLTVARLVTRKGIDVVLRALPQVLARHPRATYVVVGDGPDYARLARLAGELGVTRHVRFVTGAERELAEYYNACDVFVMPAREEAADLEGFGLVFLEAGACGKPVIGARAGGAVDAIVDQETGLLVPPEDPTELARVLLALLDDPLRREQLGRSARERILAGYTWQHAAAKIAQRLSARL